MNCRNCIFIEKQECMHHNWRGMIRNVDEPPCRGAAFTINNSVLADALDSFPDHHKEGVKTPKERLKPYGN
jgi:hypothetical protein